MEAQARPVSPFPSAAPRAQGDLFQPPSGNFAGDSMAAPIADPNQQRQRLVNYLSSGGFMGNHPLRRERSHLRARAIFMLIVLAIAIFTVWRRFF